MLAAAFLPCFQHIPEPRTTGGTTSRRRSSKEPSSIRRAGGTRGRVSGPLELGLDAKKAAARVCKAAGAQTVHLRTPLMSFAFSSGSADGLISPNLAPTPKTSRKTQSLKGRLRGVVRIGYGGVGGSSMATLGMCGLAQEANGSALRAGNPWPLARTKQFSSSGSFLTVLTHDMRAFAMSIEGPLHEGQLRVNPCACSCC